MKSNSVSAAAAVALLSTQITNGLTAGDVPQQLAADALASAPAPGTCAPNTARRFPVTDRAMTMTRVKVWPELPALNPAQRYSIDEAIIYLRLSRKTVFDDIREGRLATIQEGRRRFVPGSEIARRSRAPSAA